MTYATQQDLIDRYGERELQLLTDRDAGAAIIAGVVAQALADADAEIDSYLAKRMQTPLTPTPALVRTQACAIARYRLHKDSAPEKIRADYLDAVSWLKRAASGDVTIDGTSPMPDAPSADMPQVEGPARIFGRDSLRGF